MDLLLDGSSYWHASANVEMIHDRHGPPQMVPLEVPGSLSRVQCMTINALQSDSQAVSASLRARLRDVGFDRVSEPTLARCLTELGDEFVHLVSSASASIGDEAAHRAMHAQMHRTLTCAAPMVYEALESLSLQVPLKDVIDVAEREPELFRLVKRYMRGDRESGREIQRLLRGPEQTPQQGCASHQRTGHIDTSSGVLIQAGTAALFLSAKRPAPCGHPALAVSITRATAPATFDWGKSIEFPLAVNEAVLMFGVLVGKLELMRVAVKAAGTSTVFELASCGNSFRASCRQTRRAMIDLKLTTASAARLADHLVQCIVGPKRPLSSIEALNQLVDRAVRPIHQLAA